MVSDYGAMADRVRDFKDDLEDAHEDATDEAMDTMATDVRQNIRANDSVARRVLVTDVQRDGPERGALTTEVISVPGFARYLEHGTGQRGRRDSLPHHDTYDAPSPGPPIEPIVEWLVAKNITPDEDGPYNTTYGLATAIQETIAEQGTFPHPFLRPAWFGTRGYQHVINQNRQAMRTALRRL